MSLVIDNVSVSLGGRGVLAEVSSEFKGGLNIVVGPNGAGKTTLISAIAGVVEFTGTISLQTKPLPDKPLSRSRLVSLMSQTAETPAALTALSYVEHVDLARSIWKIKRPGSDPKKIKAVLTELNVEEFHDREVSRLSGGELARVRLARALYQNARVALFDEPIAALDLGAQVKAMRLIESKFGCSIAVVVMHDLSLASRFANQIYMMHSGTIVASGSPRDVLTSKLLSQVYDSNISVTWVNGVAQILAE